ncbi:MAG: PAS domain S-box protein [Gemmatimonadaceae bacterium]|nr:PAS domain S-box protein [Gemmatimonadaceae bacterium]
MHRSTVHQLGIDARRRVKALFGGALLLLVGIASLALWGQRASRRATDAMLRMQQTVDRAGALRLSVATAAAGHRAFLLTADSASLALSREAERDGETEVAALALLTRDTPETSRQVAALVGELTALTTSRAEIVRMHASDAVAAAAALGAPDAVALRRRVATLLDGVDQTERAALHASVATFHRASGSLLAILLVALVFATLLTAWAVSATTHDFRTTAASESRLRALFDANPDGVIVQSGGRVLFANGAAAAMLGFDTPEALRGSAFFDLVHADERERARALAQTVIAEGRVVDPTPRRFLRVDHTVLETEVRAGPVVFGNTAAAVVVLRDVSERLASARALARSEQRFRSLLDAMDEGVVLQDAALAMQLWNPSAERILGLTGDQLSGVTSYDPRWRAVNEQGEALSGDEHATAIALRTRKRATRIMGVDRGNGERAWLQVNAVPLFEPDVDEPHSVECTFTDITAIRAAEIQLRESEERYRLLADNSVDLVSRQSVDHRFEYASPSHSRILGWTPDELRGRSALEFLHPEDAERVRELTARPQDGTVLPVSLVRVSHKEGHYVWLESVAKPVVDERGVVLGWQVASRDVTLRRALEDRLSQALKMEAMGRMASAVAHDFNNVLTVIRGSAELLQEKECAEDERRSATGDIVMATDRAAQLTTQLLTFARLQHSSAVDVEVAPLIRRAFPLLARLAGSEVALELGFGAHMGEAHIAAEPAQVEQVLYNLVVNARDAMPRGGTIRVQCELAHLDAPQEHRHGTIPAGRHVVISVSDNGSGMSEEVLSRLFDPFFTTKPQGKGTGLGLATVVGLVEKAEGTVVVASTQGVGSTFTVYWPQLLRGGNEGAALPSAGPSVPADAAVSTSSSPTSTTTSTTGVVVDDEDGPRRIVERVLLNAGYRVLTASSGPEALSTIRRESASVRALVTDVRMPGMSGIDLVDALLAEDIVLPVLLASGQLDVPIPTRWPSTFQHAFLGKPFARADLVLAVQQLVAASAREDSRPDATPTRT